MTDRISKLPDEVLHRILSSMPTKHAVQTSILGRRWRYLWTSVSILHLDKHLHRYPHFFADFAYRVLLLRNKSTNIDKFRLHCGFTDLSHVAAWTIFAISRNVSEIDLQIMTTPQSVLQEPGMRLARRIFTCETLIVLKISINFFLQIPENVVLHNLRILRLISFERICSGELERLVRSCPVLEELYLKLQSLFDELAIFALNLEKFYLFLDEISDHDCEHKIVVDAPKLKFFNLIDRQSIRYSLKNSASVIEAFVDYGHCAAQHSYCVSSYGVHELLDGLSNVKTLSLSANTMAALDSGVINKWPLFGRLTHLELAIHTCTDWLMLPDLLERTPMLEVLALGKDVVHCECSLEEYEWDPPHCVPLCLILRLKQLYMWGFDGRIDEMRLLRYMLKNGVVLENVSVYYRRQDTDDEAKFRRKLLMLRRRSKECEMNFYEDSYMWFSCAFSFGRKTNIWT